MNTQKKSTAPKTKAKTAKAIKPAAKKAPAKKPAAKEPKLKKTTPAKLVALVKKIQKTLDAKKGEDIKVLNISELSGVADYLILCTGLNPPHLRALAAAVAKKLHENNPPISCHRQAGSTESEWIVMDYIEIVLHFFTPATRSYYALEQLWKDAPSLG